MLARALRFVREHALERVVAGQDDVSSRRLGVGQRVAQAADDAPHLLRVRHALQRTREPGARFIGQPAADEEQQRGGYEPAQHQPFEA